MQHFWQPSGSAFAAACRTWERSVPPPQDRRGAARRGVHNGLGGVGHREQPSSDAQDPLMIGSPLASVRCSMGTSGTEFAQDDIESCRLRRVQVETNRRRRRPLTSGSSPRASS